MTEEITAYECNICSGLYEDKNEAEYCCEPKIDEIVAYKCEGCGELYHNEDDADYCCPIANGLTDDLEE